jgi:hypothetical protein
MSRKVWGYLYNESAACAAYFVQWTLTRIDHGANFDLIIGKWGDGATAADRTVVAVAYRLTASGPQFMVIDAVGRAPKLASIALSRDQVIGKPVAKDIFAMVDAIWLGDKRIAELRG